MLEEYWSVIPEAPTYSVSNLGNICNNTTNKCIKQYDNGNGYMCVRLYPYTGTSKKFYIHRLVAAAFLVQHPNCNTVNHIDGNKKNNSCNNLEWVTQHENQIHAVSTGLQKSRKHTFGKEVSQYTLDGMYLTTYVSTTVAAATVGVSKTAIQSAANGYTSKSGGFKWRYTGKETT